MRKRISGTVSYGFSGWSSCAHGVPSSGQWLCLLADGSYCICCINEGHWESDDTVIAWARIPQVGDVEQWVHEYEDFLGFDENKIPIRKGDMVYTPETSSPGGIGITVLSKHELSEFSKGRRVFVNKKQMQSKLMDDYNAEWRKQHWIRIKREN